MIFGPKFYPALDKMTNWRQSLFALTLATRQFENFALWAELTERQGTSEFKHALYKCWEFHADKFNHIDLQSLLDDSIPFFPEEEDEVQHQGARYAFDAAIALESAIEAITVNTNTAAIASKASMASVIRLCEARYEDLSSIGDVEALEEALLEKPEIEAEIDFQVELMELLKAPRAQENIVKLLEFALQDGYSNIGLEQRIKVSDFVSALEVKHQAHPKADLPYANSPGFAQDK